MLDWNVPPEISERIVRHLSERPLYKYWQNYVHAKDLFGVLGSSDQLRTAAQNQLRSLILPYEDPSFAWTWKDIQYDPDSFSPGLLVDDHTLFEPLLASLGITLQIYNVAGLGRSWLDVLKNEVAAFTELRLHFCKREFSSRGTARSVRNDSAVVRGI